MSSFTNDTIQADLNQALNIISIAIKTETEEFAIAKLEVLQSNLKLVKMAASSVNGITSLRGMGIEKAHKIATLINEEGQVKAGFLSFTFKTMMESINVSYPVSKKNKK